MADFNKNEYYRFSANLNAQIAIDEEKTKKGDVDAMVRLARYFRTGETVAFDRFEGKDVVSTWFEQQSEDGETYICDQDVIGWYASEKQFNIGKKYAKMAAEAKDARGLYEYSLYLRESLDFNSEYREICDEITELYFKIEYDDCLVPVELDEISKYEEMGIEILHTQDDSSVQKCYRALTPEEKIGREKLDFEISNLNKKRNFIRSEVEKDSLQYLQSAAESGYTDAKIELGIYFANGKWFDQLDTSISREEAAEQDYLTASWYTQKEEKAECATIDDLKFAIECLESVMESEETSKTGLAAITLGRAYANIAKTQSDIDKSVHFYKLAKESNVYATADEMTALFVNNLDAVRLDDIVYLLDKGDEYHNYDIWKDIYKIMESISDEVLKKYSNEFAKVFLKSGKLCCLGDIIVEHVNFYKVVLDNHRLIASRSPLIPIHLVERLDKHLDVEQRVDLYSFTF